MVDLRVLTMEQAENLLYEGKVPLKPEAYNIPFARQVVSESFHNREKAREYAPFIYDSLRAGTLALAPYPDEVYLIKHNPKFSEDYPEILSHETLHHVLQKTAGRRASTDLDKFMVETVPEQFTQSALQRAYRAERVSRFG